MISYSYNLFLEHFRLNTTYGIKRAQLQVGNNIILVNIVVQLTPLLMLSVENQIIYEACQCITMYRVLMMIVYNNNNNVQKVSLKLPHCLGVAEQKSRIQRRHPFSFTRSRGSLII